MTARSLKFVQVLVVLCAVTCVLSPLAGCRRAMTRSSAKVRLQYYSEEGKPDRVQAILSVYPDLVNTRNSNGETPLFRAVSFGQLDVVDVLIKRGADVDVRDNFGITPLMEAESARRQGVAAARRLIAAGAHLDTADRHGWTTLHYAVEDANLSMIRLLVESGAIVNACNDKGETPLDVADDGEYSPSSAKDAMTVYLKKHGAKSRN